MNQRFKVVIVGRPNVGKSTLFNRLVGRRRALVHNQPGVTRDRIEAPAEWMVFGKLLPVTIVDTGGLGGEHFAEEIKKQVQMALQDTDAVLFVFDSQVGLTPLDEELLRELLRSGVSKRCPILAIVNKVDDERHEARLAEFYQVHLDQVLSLSAEHGRGIELLKETLAELFKHPGTPAGTAELLPSEEDSSDNVEEKSPLESSLEETEFQETNESHHEGESEPGPSDSEDLPPRIAIVGRPNVGKSTLLNALLGEERMITSNIAGTTVDAVDSLVELNDKKFVVIDTAGIRRKSKTEQGVEVLSVVQAKKTLERADIAILVLDGEVGVTDQDEKIGGMIEEMGCGVVLVMNKWDLQRRTGFQKEDAAERIRSSMGFLKYAPILFVSAKRRQGLNDLGDLLHEIRKQRRLKISTHEFTEWIRKETTAHNPRNAKFYLCHQSGRNPPTFVCHVNDPEKIHFSLKRHLINALRDRWGYMGNPVRLLFLEAKRRSLPRK